MDAYIVKTAKPVSATGVQMRSEQLVGSVCAHGYLAQLVERLTVNQIVKGSIPLISVTLTEVVSV